MQLLEQTELGVEEAHMMDVLPRRDFQCPLHLK